MPAPPEDSPYQLLVEGSDDRHTVIHLMKRNGFDWDDRASTRPFISARGGISGLPRDLPVFLRSAAYQRIGIVLDANSDLSARWTQARQRGAKCQPKDHIKSTLHTWLAWQAKPGLPFGTALQAEIFEKDSADALRFVAWFRSLFAN